MVHDDWSVLIGLFSGHWLSDGRFIHLHGGSGYFEPFDLIGYLVQRVDVGLGKGTEISDNAYTMKRRCRLTLFNLGWGSLVHFHRTRDGSVHLFDLLRNKRMRMGVDCGYIRFDQQRSELLTRRSARDTLDFLRGFDSTAFFHLTCLGFILIFQRVYGERIILPSSPYTALEVGFEGFLNSSAVRFKTFIPNTLGRHTPNLIRVAMHTLSGLLEGEVVLDRQQIDLTHDQELEESAVERGVVALSLSSFGFIAFPFLPPEKP